MMESALQQRFFAQNIGNPSAPVPQWIRRSIVVPTEPLDEINGIGFHAFDGAPHYPPVAHWENEVLLFLTQLWDSSPAETADWLGFGCGSGTLGNLQAVAMAAAYARGQEATLRLFHTAHAHYSLHKAARLLDVETVVVEGLPQVSPPIGEVWLLWHTFGDTQLGAFEPGLDVRRSPSCFVHLDAAYGGLLVGMKCIPALDLGTADSVVVDFHKTGRLPLTRSFFLARRHRWQDFHMGAAYVPGNWDRTILGSRPVSHVAQMAAYGRDIGCHGHRDWLSKLERFASHVEYLFRQRDSIRSVSRMGNLILVRPLKLVPRSHLEAFNVSQQWRDGSPTPFLRVFAWEERGIDPYVLFLDGLDA